MEMVMLSTPIEAEIAKNDTTPPSWSVEAIDVDDEGGIDVTIFSGPRAYERSVDYARSHYGFVRERRI